MKYYIILTHSSTERTIEVTDDIDKVAEIILNAHPMEYLIIYGEKYRLLPCSPIEGEDR